MLKSWCLIVVNFHHLAQKKKAPQFAQRIIFGKEALKELKSPYLDDRFLCVASI
jgi:hypothetical protein